jgi:predicted nucleic acid-binding protein
MPLSHLLDTSVYSQPIKDNPLDTAMNRWSHLKETSICTSAICLVEVLQGLRQRDSLKYWRRYRQLLENQYPVLAFDASVAETFSILAANARRQGKPKPAVDLMIAATACCHGLVLATLNARDFVDIPGLSFENWNHPL